IVIRKERVEPVRKLQSQVTRLWVTDQLCSARKTPAACCLSLPARNERGESRREGKLIKSASSPRPSPPFLRRRGRENAVAHSKQIVCRTQLSMPNRTAHRGHRPALFWLRLRCAEVP